MGEKKTTATGVALIKQFEGCRLTAYRDIVGVLTIGYGHTGADVTEGLKISQQEATALLKKDLAKFEAKVNKYNHIYHFKQREFNALVSFAYNVGSIDGLTQNGTRDLCTIAKKMLLYNRAGGREVAGLTRRRQAEYNLFAQGYNKRKGVEKL